MSMFKSKLNISGKERVVICINHKDEEQVTEVKMVDSIHHIMILDRSGSMYTSINELIDVVQNSFNYVNENDYLTVMYFSSAGQYRTVIKAAKKQDSLTKLMDSMRSTLGCTCFSESLKEVNSIIDELGSLAPISVTLYTDGQPIVPWSIQEEESRCFIELTKMKDKIYSFNTIGFSNYYNQELLKKFSSYSEFGTFTHSSQIKEYEKIFTHNFNIISDIVCEKVDISTVNQLVDVIYLNRSFTKMTNGEFCLSKIDKRKNQFFLISDDEFEFMYNGKWYPSKDVKINMNPATITNFYYAYAYNLYYSGDRKASLDILSINLHDRALIDSHMSSFTFDESAKHLKKLENALFNNGQRFIDGIADDNYLPAEDALCVMDILNFLQESGKSFYIPYSKNVKSYDRIGKKTEESVNYFIWTDKEIRASFSDFVYNKEHMNLSIRFTIPGIVNFNPKRAKALNMPLTMESIIYKNHTIIKDGNLNIKQIEVLIHHEDYETLETNDCIEMNQDGVWETVTIEDELYYRRILNFEGFPIINGMYINKSKSIEDIFNDTVKIAKLEAKQKIINYYLDLVNEKSVLKKVDKLAGYTTEQIQFLEEHGLSKELVYQGLGKIQKSAEECDSYQSRTMKFELSGCSSWPKIDELLSARDNNKKMKISLLIMNEQYDILSTELNSKNILLEKVNAALRDELLEKLKEVKKEINCIRNDLAVLKIAKLLTGDWFTDLNIDDKGNYYFEKGDYKMIAKAAYTTEYF